MAAIINGLRVGFSVCRRTKRRNSKILSATASEAIHMQWMEEKNKSKQESNRLHIVSIYYYDIFITIFLDG